MASLDRMVMSKKPPVKSIKAMVSVMLGSIPHLGLDPSNIPTRSRTREIFDLHHGSLVSWVAAAMEREGHHTSLGDIPAKPGYPLANLAEQALQDAGCAFARGQMAVKKRHLTITNRALSAMLSMAERDPTVMVLRVETPLINQAIAHYRISGSFKLDEILAS